MQLHVYVMFTSCRNVKIQVYVILGVYHDQLFHQSRLITFLQSSSG